jgi:hypothetical protein
VQLQSYRWNRTGLEGSYGSTAVDHIGRTSADVDRRFQGDVATAPSPYETDVRKPSYSSQWSADALNDTTAIQLHGKKN